jgi:hypothetical protein
VNRIIDAIYVSPKDVITSKTFHNFVQKFKSVNLSQFIKGWSFEQYFIYLLVLHVYCSSGLLTILLNCIAITNINTELKK